MYQPLDHGTRSLKAKKANAMIALNDTIFISKQISHGGFGDCALMGLGKWHNGRIIRS